MADSMVKKNARPKWIWLEHGSTGRSYLRHAKITATTDGDRSWLKKEKEESGCGENVDDRQHGTDLDDRIPLFLQFSRRLPFAALNHPSQAAGA